MPNRKKLPKGAFGGIADSVQKTARRTGKGMPKILAGVRTVQRRLK